MTCNFPGRGPRLKYVRSYMALPYMSLSTPFTEDPRILRWEGSISLVKWREQPLSLWTLPRQKSGFWLSAGLGAWVCRQTLVQDIRDRVEGRQLFYYRLENAAGEAHEETTRFREV